METNFSQSPRKRRRSRSEILPELAPPPETGWWRKTTGPDGTRIEAGMAPKPKASAKAALLARIGVGTLSAVLFLTASPVGAGLLALNTLGGPQIRLTAQVTALSGLWIPLVG